MKIFARVCALMVCMLSVFNTAHAEQNTPEIKTLWSVDVDQRLPNSSVALSSPAVVQHGQDVWVVLAGRDGWVHVYAQNTGQEVRRFFLGAPSDSAALALQNGNVVVGDVRGRLYVVDPAEGVIVWQKQLTASFTIQPVAIENDFIIQTTENALYRFSPSGEKRWSYSGSANTLSMYLGATPLVVDEQIFALLNNGDAVALKAYTGDLLWKRQLLLSNITSNLAELKAPLASPLFVPQLSMGGENGKNVLLIPFFHDELFALSAVGGVQSFSLPVSLKSTPKLVGSIMYMADSSGFLHAYNIDKGNRLWSKKIAGHALMGPVLWQDSLWLVGSKGTIYRLNMNGEVQDKVTLAGEIIRLPVVTKTGLLIRTDRGVMAMVH